MLNGKRFKLYHISANELKDSDLEYITPPPRGCIALVEQVLRALGILTTPFVIYSNEGFVVDNFNFDSVPFFLFALRKQREKKQRRIYYF